VDDKSDTLSITLLDETIPSALLVLAVVIASLIIILFFDE